MSIRPLASHSSIWPVEPSKICSRTPGKLARACLKSMLISGWESDGRTPRRTSPEGTPAVPLMSSASSARLREQRLRARQDPRPELGQGDAAARAVEQAPAPVPLELSDLAADRGLRGVEHHRRFREAAELRNLYEEPQPCRSTAATPRLDIAPRA